MCAAVGRVRIWPLAVGDILAFAAAERRHPAHVCRDDCLDIPSILLLYPQRKACSLQASRGCVIISARQRGLRRSTAVGCFEQRLFQQRQITRGRCEFEFLPRHQHRCLQRVPLPPKDSSVRLIRLQPGSNTLPCRYRAGNMSDQNAPFLEIRDTWCKGALDDSFVSIRVSLAKCNLRRQIHAWLASVAAAETIECIDRSRPSR